MREHILLTGMILEASPVNDYDRRLVVLTKERGKVTIFARGARRMNSKLTAATAPFTFGEFKVVEGKSAYTLIDIDVQFYFEELRENIEGAYLGMYFLEYASYYAKENNDELELLKLLFQSVRAIVKGTIELRLIRAVYELKILVVNGEFPGIPRGKSLLAGTEHTIDFIIKTPIERLYTFTVSETVLKELCALSDDYRKKFTDHSFKSLKALASLP
ncbi:MAG: DNA repair protein RecO [Lachnospiraceae bacterium]|nr:DNA repair protein RecO [Lachnospiraceae bacterium]MBR2275458.1 DNA repair protein RecO [Lachnospiraceae bacterium]